MTRPPQPVVKTLTAPKGAVKDLPTQLMGTGSLDRLGSLVDRFVFFTPAVPFLFGRFPIASLLSFCEENPSTIFLHRKFQYPIFSGLVSDTGDAAWNYAIWAIFRSLWDAFESHMLATTSLDSSAKFYATYPLTQVDIQDPLYLEKHGGVAASVTLPVVAFGADTSAGQYAILPNAAAPVLRKYPVSVKAKTASSSLFSGSLPAGWQDSHLD
jgi:hypothetical protein